MNSTTNTTKLAISARAVAVWIVLILAEILHGIARGVLLVPHLGEFRSGQVGVFTGSCIILLIAIAAVRWLGASRFSQFVAVGILWVVLTVAFEVLFGRLVIGATWQRLAADYDLPHGGLMPLGLVVLLLSPWIASKVRGQSRSESR